MPMRAATRRVPVFATVVVAAAVATMIALGFWQLQRRAEKEALLAQYARAATVGSEVAWPLAPEDYPRSLYRHVQIDCASVAAVGAVAGRSQGGKAGWAHVARCRLAGGGEAAVALGWSDRPRSPQWRGGTVRGIVGPAGKGIRLVAFPPQAGLAPLAVPDPGAIPNNHLSYAVQWFAFAATALVIYALALRKRRQGR